MSRRARIALASTLLSAAVACLAVAQDPESAADGEQAAARARAVLERDAYQTELPRGPDSGEIGDEAGRDGRPTAHRWRLPVPAAAGSVATALAWAMLGALALAAVVALVSVAAAGLRRRRSEVAADPTAAGDDHRAVPRRGDPRSLEAMLAAGDYAAAVHALLVRAIAHLEARARRQLPASATSREILDRPEARAAKRRLAVLVAAVERSRFGGLVLDRDDYERVRAAYNALLAGPGAGP